MDNNSNNLEKDLTPEQAEAWVFTLILGFITCLGLVIYTLITHHFIFNYQDPTLFKPEFAWLGFIGMCLYLATFMIFWIGSTIVKYLPNKIQVTNLTNILGIVFLLLFCIAILFSFDLQTKKLHCIGLICEAIGLNITITKDIIEYRFGKIAKSWNLFGVIVIFTGVILLAFSIDT